MKAALVAGAFGAAVAGYVPCVDGPALQSKLQAAAGNVVVQGAVAVAALAVVYKKVQAARAKAAFEAELRGYEKGRVYLFIAMPRVARLVDAGLPHFVGNLLKLEAWCRLHKVPYELKVGMHYASFSPTETLPFVALNGELCGDSELCLEWLAKKLDKPLYDDRELATDAQKATALVIRRTLEWHCSPQASRQTIVDNPHVMAKLFKELAGYPTAMVNIFVGRYRKATIHKLNTSSIGWQSDERCREEYIRDFVAFERFIAAQGPNGFLLTKDAPTAIDCAAYAHLASMVLLPEEGNTSPCLAYLAQSKPLRAYIERMNKLLFPSPTELKSGPQRFF